MRKLTTSVFVAVLVLTGCGGGDEGSAEPSTSQPGTSQPGTSQPGTSDTQQVEDGEPDDSSVTTSSEPANPDTDSEPGSQDNPIPEGSGPLPANSIRIGDEIFEQMVGASLSDCFVQDGPTPFSVNGALNDDDRFRFNVDYVEEGVFESLISNDEIFWVAAPMREGTELDVEWDVDAQTVSGTGLFNDSFRGLWAFGSFQFTCGE